MEVDQNVASDHEGSAAASPDPVSEGKVGADSTDAEYIDSPEAEDAYEDIQSPPSHPENSSGKNMDYVSRNSPEGTSTMEGELDFEDEVSEEKEEISKESLLDEDSQKDAGDSEKFMVKQRDAKEKGEEVEDEDGQLSPEEIPEKKEGSVEEGEDDGEVSDEDDLEEGEVKDASPTSKQQSRQVCRFFNRGQCTWGNLCRFLHLSVNDRGNYNMFAPSSKSMSPYAMPLPPAPITIRRTGPEYLPPPPPPLPPPPIPVSEPAPVESAWERGLRHAKELLKKSMRRKEQEPDFEEKRLNLTLDENDRLPVEYDKENEYFGKPPYRRPDVLKYEEPDDVFDNGEQEAREHWRGGRYENFEIRWTRTDVHKDRRDKERSRNTRVSVEREKPKQWRGKSWRDERLAEIQTSRTRADEWRDPWRRSKTPKGRRSRSRNRSRGSYSSVSSRSYSGSRSSRSSYSYSRSTSRSSFYSSRSRSPAKPSPKRKLSPRKDMSTSVKVPSPYKRKPITLRRTRSRSYSRSQSSRSLSRSRSSSSRSRSVTRTPSASRSRSRSYSRSLSMDSVSSASSSISHSSSRSGSAQNRNAHPSVLRKTEDAKREPKPPPDTSLLSEIQRLKQYDRMRETQNSGPVAKKPNADSAPQEKKKPPSDVGGAAASLPPLHPNASPDTNTAVLQQPAGAAVKEGSKQIVPKQQIKLTLLNKALPSKIPNPLKKEPEAGKAKAEKEEKTTQKVTSKRSSSPGTKGVGAAKRSTSSRRDELLKQLKAVEDAIARKRAKFS